MDERKSESDTRRRFIRLATGSVGLAIAPMTGSASGSIQSKARNDDTEYKFTIDDDSDEITLNKSKGKGQSRNSPESENTDIDKIVQEMNEEAADGYLDFHEKDDTVFVEPTDKVQTEYQSEHGDVNTFSHGKTDYEFKGPGWTRPYATHYFYLDDSDTEYLSIRLGQGAALAGLASWIASATGAGTVAAGVLAALAAFLGVVAGELQLKNDGHGVRFKVIQLPISPGPEWVSISSQ